MNVLSTNFSGGEDHSTSMIALEFDEETNLVWNNLSRSTSEKINRQGVEILLKEQEKYMESNEDIFSTNNIYHLKGALTRGQFLNIEETDIEDFFAVVKSIYQPE